MIPNDKKVKLIHIYLYVCDLYNDQLIHNCQRYSNNFNIEFTDQEIMTIYLFTVDQQRYYSIKEIYSFAKEYLLDWFPKLPSYQQFNIRLNNLTEAFKSTLEHLIENFIPQDCDLNTSLVDSFPIMTCTSRNRKGKVAKELTDKGFCSTKNMYYYGVKLNALVYRRKGKLPFPEQLICTPASMNDLDAFKQAWGETITNRTVFGDKSYTDQEYFDTLKKSKNLLMLAPIKLVKGEGETIRMREKAFRDAFGKAVSKVRQPVESFFNWLNEKTNIQRASKVRSTKGLLIHLFGRITAAFIKLIF